MKIKNFSQFRITAVYLVILPLVMRETRSSIILTRIAKKLRKTTGDHRYRARVEDERASLANLIFISCTRPVRKLNFFFSIHINAWIESASGLMCTELVVASFSVSNLDGCSFDSFLTFLPIRSG